MLHKQLRMEHGHEVLMAMNEIDRTSCKMKETYHNGSQYSLFRLYCDLAWRTFLISYSRVRQRRCLSTKSFSVRRMTKCRCVVGPSDVRELPIKDALDGVSFAILYLLHHNHQDQQHCYLARL